MDLRHAFLGAVREWGAQDALVEGEKAYSRRQAAAGAAALSRIAASVGGGQPGNVGVLMPNCSAFVPAFYGAMFAGGVPVPLNPIAPPGELLYTIQNAGMRAIFTISPLRPHIEELRKALGAAAEAVAVFYADDELKALAQSPPGEAEVARVLAGALAREAPEVACMIYSSGTTGRPKGIMLTHSNLLSNHSAIREHIAVSDKDVFHGVLPFFHSLGLAFLHLSLFCGARLIMSPRFTPGAVLRAVNEQGATGLVMAPQMWRVLLGADGVREANWRGVRLCISGGGPASSALRQAWREASGLPLRVGYGLTEYSPVVSVEMEEPPCDESVGQLLPGVEAKIVGENGEELAEGQEGEVWVRGPSVMKGYYGNLEATCEVLTPDGWLRTGDDGFLRAGRWLALKGRRKEIIIVAGENVHPIEIEEALATHPSVAEAAVAGVPDPTHGEASKAFVVLRPGAHLNITQLRAHLRERLTPYKIPHEFVAVESLPKNAMGKVLKRELLSARP